MKNTIKLVLLTLALTATTQAKANNAKTLLKGWSLESFVIIGADHTERAFCTGENGLIIYEKSGHVSVSINCAPKETGGTEGVEPADAYGRMLFYAGTFTVENGEVVHSITNSNSLPLIGRTLRRKLAELTEKTLVLTGPFGGQGESLRIVWKAN